MKDRGDTGLRRVSTAFVHGFLNAFWGVRITGLENVPKDGPAIYAGNHISNLDGPLLAIAISKAGRWPCFIGKAELWKVPVLSWWLRNTGCFPVDRHKGDIAAMRVAQSAILEGGGLGMFPQGTRGGKGAKAGIGFLARKTGVPVIPAHIIGSDRWPLGGGLEVRLGPALRFEGDAQAFALKVMDTIYSL